MPAAVERNTYVLFSSVALMLIFWQWRPMGGVIWDVSNTTLGSVMIAISLLGWMIVLISTFLLSHFELTGLSQALSNLTGKEIQGSNQFKTPSLYRYVRHPIYLGFTVAFWSTDGQERGISGSSPSSHNGRRMLSIWLERVALFGG